MSVFIIIVFLSLMMGKSGGAIRPEVTFTPNWRNILEGDNVTLTCDVTSTVPEEPRTYHWYKDGRTIHRDETTLQIESSAERDSGDYQCRINTGDISDPVTLNVTNRFVLLQRPPSAIYEGDPLTLRCHLIVGFISYLTKFFKNNEEIKSQFPDSELHIEEVDLNTAGHYKCTKRIVPPGRSGFHEFSDEFSLSVRELFSLPKIKIASEWVIEGDEMTVRCDTRLDPHRGGTELYFTFYRDEENVLDFDVSGTYRVPSSQPEDSGKYTCEVRTTSNTVRKRSDEINIRVYNFVILQRPPSAIYEGDPLTLRCHHIEGFIGSQTRFFKNNEEIKSQFPGSEFHIEKVDLNTSGLYKCTKRIVSPGRSGYLEHSDEFSLSVRELFSRPEIKVTPSRVIGGDEMTVRCDTRLDPLRGGTELHFTFYRDGRTVRGYNVSDTYRVPSFQLEDSGNYTCEVRTRSDTVRKMSDGLYIQIYDYTVQNIIRLVISGFVLAASLCFIYFHNKW